MSKVLKVAAEVVGVVALIATGAGALGAGAIIGSLTFATVGTVAGVAATALSLAAAATTKPPQASISGNQDKFTANMDQGVPYVVGRTAVAGFIVHRQTFDWAGTKDNTFQTFFAVWGGGGPYHALEAFQVDSNTVTFSGDVGNDCAQGGYNDGHNTGWMWQRHQLGACPEATALWATGYYNYPAGWSASSRMSGYAAFSWTLKFDTSGKAYPGAAVPQPRGVLQGALVYDPRLDDTYPGGSGGCRALQEATYVYSENPALHALTWALGRWQNGKRVLGIGMAVAAIVMPAYVEAANVADANGWKVGGVVYSTDGKWDVLKKMLLACSGEPLQLGGTLSCVVDTPRVSLATITDNDIIGKSTVPGAPRIVDRINGVIPTYREETQDWQLVPAAKVVVADYLAADGKPRTKAITWELVQQVTQVGQLATYAICNSREIDGIVLPLKLRWIGYKPGDAITVASSTVGLANQLVVVRKRSLDPSSGAVTMTMRTETTGKHALALGQTTTAPPAPALQAIDRTQLLQPGISASWSATLNDNGLRPEDGATRNVPRGEWNAASIYAQGDIVTYQGSSFIAGSAVPAGAYPTNTIYWDQLAVGGATGPQGIPGANGQNIHIAYADSADGSSNFVAGVANPGRAYIGVYSDTNATGSTDYQAYTWSRWTGLNGPTGSQGAAGPIGPNGQQSYVHFAYADSVDGSYNFAVGTPGSRSFIGIYSDYTSASSGDYHAYNWSLIKGADGATGATGPQGVTGGTGATGGVGPAGTNGVDGLTALNIHTVGSVSWDGHNLLAPNRSNSWNNTGAYSSNVIPGGVSLTFQRPNWYDSQGEDAFVGLASSPTSSLDYPAVEFAWRMCKTASGYNAEVWHAGSVLYTEGWSGANIYSIRYDTNTGIITWYRIDTSNTTTAVCAYNAGTGRSFGFEATAGGSMSLVNVAFTAAGGTGATGAAGPVGPQGGTGGTGATGPAGQNGTSPTPDYAASPLGSPANYAYPNPVPVANGQTITFYAQMYIGRSNASGINVFVTVQTQYSLDNASWTAFSGGNNGFTLHVQSGDDPTDNDSTTNTYTNNSGVDQVLYLRTVVTASGSGSATYSPKSYQQVKT